MFLRRDAVRVGSANRSAVPKGIKCVDLLGLQRIATNILLLDCASHPRATDERCVSTVFEERRTTEGDEE